MRWLAIFGALAVCATAVPVYSQAWSKWLRVTTPDGQFSAETPCTAGEIELLGTRPADLNIGVPMEAATRVLCKKGEAIFVAGIVRDPGFEQLETNAFDWIRNETLSNEGRKGDVREGFIDGRRAFMNRETGEGNTSEIGYVEISKTTLILFLAGGPFKQSRQAEVAIERFTQSIKVAAQ